MSTLITINATDIIANSRADINTNFSTLNTDKAEVTGKLSQFATTTSLELKGVISDETGSGALVFATAPALSSPVLTTPALGTPSSGVLTSCTGLPEAGLTLADNTTADVSTTKHGFTPKAPNDSTKFLRGDATWAVPASAGENIVFVPAGAFVPGANCNLTASGTTAWIPIANFIDTNSGKATLSVKVPKSCSGITSIEVIYQNEVASTLQLYLEYETASLNLDSLPSAVVSDTNGGLAQYASDSTIGNIAKVTVPAAAYNGLTNVDADDLITMRINREGGNANDTYGANWAVIGVVFTFTAV